MIQQLVHGVEVEHVGLRWRVHQPENLHLLAKGVANNRLDGVKGAHRQRKKLMREVHAEAVSPNHAPTARSAGA